TPFVSDALMRQLEGAPDAVDTRTQPADAIVVLGGGTYFRAIEYGGDTVGERTLARLRYAAKLHRDTGKPILVTGGKPLGNAFSEGAQMKAVLQQEFIVPVRWVEGDSDNTAENARLSYARLAPFGIRRIYLVSHAWHLPRAARAFRSAGFEVVPAPTAFTTRYRTDLLTFVPNADALRDSRWFMHEVIGMLWYRLKS
ncbi:MAG: YdcF family protein, partial [Gallionella sp.]|nr:YdcF family protein [Gallionella sp.]